MVYMAYGTVSAKGMSYYSYGLAQATNGARCGPQNVCWSNECIEVPAITEECKRCLGKTSGCDQTGKCFCERDENCDGLILPLDTPAPGELSTSYFYFS